MQTILNFFFGLFAITATITHIWTVIIAVSESGVIGWILTAFLPVLSELYWMFKMFGRMDAYAYITLAHLILGALFLLCKR